MTINVYGNVTLERVKKEIENMLPEEQLNLIDILIHKLISQRVVRKKTTVNIADFYGLCRGMWNNEDAQEYVNKLREERI
ncbi:MAG: hypothetical protein CVT88_06800 [Candidatus Altiarchaeales archaeon HGW-Altiarchaeales-1]|nr:MAG: hypothetical protein CVT89_04105 [Candidatus Altiarchaeales archaeon HGW-Altiarchaeales-2]PKP58749.1 MAG: hypothetical protein CVT88_06800 [Candidatus Altiarchaeales archaeon HGW-Altiarchaeales-1]